jgi:hypothetical protein
MKRESKPTEDTFNPMGEDSPEEGDMFAGVLKPAQPRARGTNVMM